MDLRVAPRERQERARDRAGAPHVPLHVLHAGGRLDRNAAGVERDALADEGDGYFDRAAGAVIFDREQLRLAPRALAYAEQRAHAELAHLILAEHLDLGGRSLEGFAAERDEAFGIDDIRWLGDKRAGQFHAVSDRRLARPCCLRAVTAAHDHNLLQARLLPLGQLGAILVIAPAAQPDAARHRSRGRRAIVQSKVGKIDD